MASNRKIETLILPGTGWEIDLGFGIDALAKYYSDLALLEKGVPFSELKYSESRQNSKPEIILSDSLQIAEYGFSSTQIQAGSIAHLKLSGVMRMQDGISSDGIETFISNLNKVGNNPNFSGAIITANSGGGESLAGTELKNALSDFVRNTGKPVFVYAQMMGSAALRGLLPATYIFASSASSLIGSVGTYTTVNKRLLDYMRENYQDYYARQSTSKNREYRELMGGNAEPLIDRITENAQQFIDEVLEGRYINGGKENIARVSSGELFSGVDALELGLVDGIGTFQTALKKLSGVIEESRNKIFFQNQKISDMSALNQFLQKMIPGLNSRLSVALPENASADEVLKALEQEGQEIESTETESTETTDNSAKLLSTIQQLTDKLTKMESDLAKIQANNKKLEVEIASLKGTSEKQADDGTQEKSQEEAPDMSKFKTITQFTEAARIPGAKVKYAAQ